MRICACVCVQAQMYVSMDVCVHTCMSVQAQMCVSTDVCEHGCVCVHACMRVTSRYSAFPPVSMEPGGCSPTYDSGSEAWLPEAASSSRACGLSPSPQLSRGVCRARST